MVTVTHEVLVADPVDRNRRQRSASPCGEPHQRPAARLQRGGRKQRSNATALWSSKVPTTDSIVIVCTPSRCRGATAAQPVSSARYTSWSPSGGRPRRRRARAARRRRRASRRKLRIELIAAEAGFGSGTALRQHFQRSVGVAPNAYRRAFHVEPVAG
jgi:hypothetical protein